jgi:hypothetical protein
MAYEFESELGAHPEFEDEFEEEFEDEMEDEAGEGEGWLGAIGNVVGSLLGEEEGEYEHEEEISPIRKIYPDAMMEHLGELAAEAETEDEAAEHFLPLIGMAASKLLPVIAKAVGPLAKKALPKIAHAVTRATPHLTRNIGTMARKLHQNPQTRHLLKTVPTIARRTVGTIAHHAARGRTVSPQRATRVLATQARRVLGNPSTRRYALRRHGILERRFHRRHHPWYMGRHGRYAQRYGAPALTHGGGIRTQSGSPGARPVRYGQIVGGRCTCPASSAPHYCRCCGQLIR